MTNTVKNLFDFIENSPTAFHAVAKASEILSLAGYTHIYENDNWNILPCGKYFVTKNSSSIIAFEIPESGTSNAGFMICASHSDSPTFKFKDSFELETFGEYLRANTERYGGAILSSWFDRPLSAAGRAVYRSENGIKYALFNIDKDLTVIPSVAIHMNRSVNEGFKINAQVDTLPLLGAISSKGKLKEAIAKEISVNAEDILSLDAFLYCREKCTTFGLSDEYISAPRIDNLQCAFSSVAALTESEKSDAIKVLAIFDNEETGSDSKQGAASTFLYDTLMRIEKALGGDDISLRRAFAKSFMLSADNGHARHPNHPEYSDAINTPILNKGVVVKFNASQKYATDAISAALVYELCKKADVPCQTFANRSDLPGGSTLGTISDTKVSIITADIGLPQLAMHSAYETAGAEDTAHMVNLMKKFYESTITPTENGFIIK